MMQKDPSTPMPVILLRARNSVILHQTLCAVAKLGVADCFDGGWRSTAEVAQQVGANEDALYRVLRLLASQGIFEEDDARRFRNTEVSYFLRSGVPGSLRALLIFWGSDLSYVSLGQMMRTVMTGESAPMLLAGIDSFEQLRRDPEQARVFDDAMTTMSEMAGPAIAEAYDFGAWESVMDVGGGNGILLAHILRAYPTLRGVLADQEHVLERARERGYLGGDLETRSTMEACNFFEHVPAGSRAYVMKSVIHDWDDVQARTILGHCRRAIPKNGVLLLVEWELGGENVASNGKFIDVAMLSMTGGRERTEEEYRELLASAGFRLNRMIPTAAQLAVIEAFPV